MQKANNYIIITNCIEKLLLHKVDDMVIHKFIVDTVFHETVFSFHCGKISLQ